MLKFIHLFKNYYLGLSVIGIIAFVIKEIPYIIMPLVNPVHNPIMCMKNEIEWLVTIQNITGVLTMAMLMLIHFSYNKWIYEFYNSVNPNLSK